MKNEVKDVEPPREVKPRQIQQRKTSLTGVLSLAASGNSSKLEELLQSFPEMAISRDGSGFTAVHYAALNDQTDCLEVLIKKKADIKAVDNSESTALHCAAESGSVQCIRLLLHHGIHVDAKNSRGETALFCASKEGQLGAVKLLVKGGANIDISDNDGKTAINVAKTERIKTFLESSKPRFFPFLLCKCIF